jgi:uncharacterized membrane protein YgdD (TMEM256/DUF423 family)
MRWLATGSLVWALGVVAGAFGAHALAARLDQHALALWETATRYAIYGGLMLCVIGLTARDFGARGLMRGAPWLLLVGVGIFSGTVGALALGAPRWFGAVTPLGGVAMIVGALLFAYRAFQPR